MKDQIECYVIVREEINNPYIDEVICKRVLFDQEQAEAEVKRLNGLGLAKYSVYYSRISVKDFLNKAQEIDK